MTSERTSDWEGLKALHIHNPTIRYVHRILANTIFNQINNGRVNSKELFFLHAAFASTRVNTTPFMLACMHLICARGVTPFDIGGLVTSRARALGVSTELKTLQPLPTPSLDIDSCRAQRLIKARRDDIYSLMVGNREIRSIILPCHTRTNVRNKSNWLYDLTSPEPDHLVLNDIPMQDNQGGQTDDEFDEMKKYAPTFSDPITRAHTLHMTFLTLL